MIHRLFVSVFKLKCKTQMVFDENDTGFDGAYPVREFMELMKKL